MQTWTLLVTSIPAKVGGLSPTFAGGDRDEEAVDET
jgi:hypothetical protein